ncbi:MAG: hypothetical protein V5A45_05280 [Haloarculaceae archaeon]
MDDAGFTAVLRMAGARERLQTDSPSHRRIEHRSPADTVGHILAGDVDANRAVPVSPRNSVVHPVDDNSS